MKEQKQSGKERGGGFKYDDGKLLAAIPFEDFPLGLTELIKVSTMGAKKYNRSSWTQVPNAEERYRDAMARHFIASFQENKDQESGLDHLAHLIWNALALMQLKGSKINE